MKPITNLTNALRILVDRFRDAWSFEEANSSTGGVETRAVWRYDFYVRSCVRSTLARPFAWLSLVSFWRPTMQNALECAMRQAEAAAEKAAESTT